MPLKNNHKDTNITLLNLQAKEKKKVQHEYSFKF